MGQGNGRYPPQLVAQGSTQKSTDAPGSWRLGFLGRKQSEGGSGRRRRVCARASVCVCVSACVARPARRQGESRNSGLLFSSLCQKHNAVPRMREAGSPRPRPRVRPPLPLSRGPQGSPPPRHILARPWTCPFRLSRQLRPHSAPAFLWRRHPPRLVVTPSHTPLLSPTSCWSRRRRPGTPPAPGPGRPCRAMRRSAPFPL